tara:strand:+ start:199 stop:408 length:210 start_codon:yes stop_codon:yes gene_type:complete
LAKRNYRCEGAGLQFLARQLAEEPVYQIKVGARAITDTLSRPAITMWHSTRRFMAHQQQLMGLFAVSTG